MLKLYNSLSRRVEPFEPINSDRVRVYTCGPTVYDYVTVGNWRTYFLSDVIVRTLVYLGYTVDYVMNITDVGHLSGDNLGDASIGSDRMEQASKREQKSAWEIAKYYIDDFMRGYSQLNLIQPKVFARATEHINEQVDLIQKIEQAGYAYRITDGLYFDTAAYERDGHRYGELSTLDQIKEGARVEPNPQRRNQRDFALWKFNTTDKTREMEWDSPWGRGFPGWHIECSAMSMKYLGEQLDIHVGGEDLRSTHHPNEIAQSEAVTNKNPFVKYWVHGAFLTVDGGRMGKSLGNAYNLHDLKDKGIDPMVLRYFYCGGHYRKQINFTWQAIESARTALGKLVDSLAGYQAEKPDVEKVPGSAMFRERFRRCLEDDFNLPQAVAVVWEVVKSDLSDSQKSELVLDFDRVLGLGLDQAGQQKVAVEEIPAAITKLVKNRDEYRRQGDYANADRIRQEMLRQGFMIKDTNEGPVIKKTS